MLDHPSLAALGAATGVVVVGSAGGWVSTTGADVAGAAIVVVGSVGTGATTTGRSGSLVDGRAWPRPGHDAGSSPYQAGSNHAGN